MLYVWVGGYFCEQLSIGNNIILIGTHMHAPDDNGCVNSFAADSDYSPRIKKLISLEKNFICILKKF